MPDQSSLQLRTVSSDGLELPPIGIGCWSYGSDEKFVMWGKTEQELVNKTVDSALSNGKTLFDTAEAYHKGKSEEALGNALRASANAKNALIASKINPENCVSPEKIRKALNDSLERLAVDCIDLYQVHWPCDATEMKQAFETLAELQKEGKIRHIGLSNFGPKQLQQAMDAGAKVSTHQLMYNLFSRAIEEEVIPLCNKYGIKILAYSPIMQGLLSDRYTCVDDFPKARKYMRHYDSARAANLAKHHGESGAEAEINVALPEIQKIAGELGISTVELSIAWCLANPAVCTVLVGARNPAQLDAFPRAAAVKLSADVVRRLNELTDPVKAKLGSGTDMYFGKDKARSW